MAKPVGQRCVHCLSTLTSETASWDHGVPQSFYPDDTVPNVPHVKAPSCKECNQRVRLIEEELLLPLALAMGPDELRAKGIPDKVMRSMTPSATEDEKEKRIRAALRKRVQESLIYPETDTGEFPGGERPELGDGSALRLSERAVQDFGEKLTRVVYWAECNNTYIEPGYVVKTHVNRKADSAAIVEKILQGRMLDVPPGIRVGVRLADDHPPVGMVVVDLWGRFRLVTSVMPAELAVG